MQRSPFESGDGKEFLDQVENCKCEITKLQANAEKIKKKNSVDLTSEQSILLEETDRSLDNAISVLNQWDDKPCLRAQHAPRDSGVGNSDALNIHLDVNSASENLAVKVVVRNPSSRRASQEQQALSTAVQDTQGPPGSGEREQTKLKRVSSTNC